MAVIIIILIFVGAGYLKYQYDEFRRYDYRQIERTGEDTRPKENDDWVNDYEYDPETKSFKHKRPRRW